MVKLYGIDPGTKTGLAIWLPSEKRFELLTTTTIVKAMDIIKTTKTNDSVVYYEDCRLRKWFSDAPTGRAAKLQGVGSVKRDCSIWAEFCALNDIEAVGVHPQSINTKLDANAFTRLTGYEGRTSEHSRDAAMIVYGR